MKMSPSPLSPPPLPRLLSIAAGLALLSLSQSGLTAGIVTPATAEGDWMQASTWKWSADHGSNPEEAVARVPDAEDVVLISRRDGSVITLSAAAPDANSVFVGHPSFVATPQQLILEQNAELNLRFLSLGRAGSSGPASEGTVEIHEGSALTVASETRLAEKKENPANNGHLLVRGGEFSTRTLLAGAAGTGEGSRILISGSNASFHTEKTAVLQGPGSDGEGAGVTLEFELDAKGVAPLYATGDVQLVDHPRLRVNLSRFDPAAVPVTIPLVTVSGGMEGEFAKAELEGVPPGIQAEVQWHNDRRSYVLILSR